MFIIINHLGKLYVIERQILSSTSLFVFLSPLFCSEIKFMSVKVRVLSTCDKACAKYEQYFTKNRQY